MSLTPRTTKKGEQIVLKGGSSIVDAAPSLNIVGDVQ